MSEFFQIIHRLCTVHEKVTLVMESVVFSLQQTVPLFFSLHCTLVTVGKNRLFSYKNIISFIVTPYLYKFYYPRFHFIKKSIIGLYVITILFEMVSHSQCPSPVVDIFTPYVLYLIYLSHQELVTHGIWQTSDLHACEMCFPLFPREVSYIVSYLPPFSFSSA